MVLRFEEQAFWDKKGTWDEQLKGVYVSTFHAQVGRYQGREERGGYVKHISARRVLR